MSRSDKTIDNDRPKNPAVRFFEWSGSEGKLRWWDKEAKQEHFIEPPFTFLVLDQLNTVKGYSDDLETGFFANEVRRDGIITLRTKYGPYKTGKWKDDIAHVKGAKFTKSVYIAFHDDGELRIGNLQFHGSALGGLAPETIQSNLKEAAQKNSKTEAFTDEFLRSIGWFGFAEQFPDVTEIAIQLTGAIADKKGATNFFRPVFREYKNVSAETNEKAIELDRQLQAYLKAYFAYQAAQEPVQELTVDDDPTADAPFNDAEPPDTFNTEYDPQRPLRDTHVAPSKYEDDIPF